MPLFRDRTEVFIVRIWLEPREIEDAPKEIRGVIQHVISGKHKSFRQLQEITTFVALFLRDKYGETQ